jgi:hypothetical protein
VLLFYNFFVQYKTTRSQELQAILARAREKTEEGNTHSSSKPLSAHGRQRPALQDFNEGTKRHTLSVKPSDFPSDESDGRYKFPGNTSRSRFIKLIAIDDRNTYYLVWHAYKRGLLGYGHPAPPSPKLK